jgi:hypothetical protein
MDDDVQNEFASLRACQTTPGGPGNISAMHAFCRNAIIVADQSVGAAPRVAGVAVIGPFGKW